MARPPPNDAQQARDRGQHRAVMAVLPALLVTMLLAFLDNMIVSTALPRIVGDLGGLDHLAWVITAYILTMTVSTPLYGKLGDLYGRKRLFVFAIVVFLVGSMLCGMATAMPELIGFRAIQGLGAGGLMVGVLAIIGDLVSPRDRGKYQGYFAALMAVATIGGPLIGGFITDNLSWRWAFYVNVPLGILALALVLAVAPAGRAPTASGRLGRRGAADRRASRPWSADDVGRQRLRVGLPDDHRPRPARRRDGTLFVLVERRVEEPILPLTCSPTATSGVSSAMGFFVGFSCRREPRSFRSSSRSKARGPTTPACCCAAHARLHLEARVRPAICAPATTDRTRRRRRLIAGWCGWLAWSRRQHPALFAVHARPRPRHGLRHAGHDAAGRRTASRQGDMGVASSTSMFTRSIGGAFGVAIFGAIFSA